jgi:hypothetical protein
MWNRTTNTCTAPCAPPCHEIQSCSLNAASGPQGYCSDGKPCKISFIDPFGPCLLCDSRKREVEQTPAGCVCIPETIGASTVAVTAEPNITQEPPSKSEELASWVIPVAVVAGICILLVIIAVLVYCLIVRKTSNSSNVDPYGGQTMHLYAPQAVAAPAPMFPSWETEQQHRMSTASSFHGAPMLQQSYSETQVRGSSGTMSMPGYAGGNNTSSSMNSMNSMNSYNSASSPQALQGRPLNYSGYAGQNNHQGATFGEKAAF